MLKLSGNSIIRFVVYITALLLFFGGVGIYREAFIYLGLLVSFLLLLIVFIYRKKIFYPKNTTFYIIFLFALLLNVFWSVNRIETLHFFGLFVGSFFFYILSFNLKEDLSKDFPYVVVFLSVSYSIIFIILKIFGSNILYGKVGMIFPLSDLVSHNHLGDLWSWTFLFLYFFIFIKKRFLFSLFIPLGVFFLIISLSRSAFVSLIVGFLYLSRKFLNNNVIGSRQIKLILIFGFLMFLVLNSFKGIIFSRPYFAESLYGFLHYPFGVGMGNFNFVVNQSRSTFGSSLGISNLTHDILLEVISGIGFFGIFFWIWVIREIVDVLKEPRSVNKLIFGSIWLAVFANFLFDYTYIIPSAFWLWFICLGLLKE